MKLSIATLASVAIAAPGKLQAQGRNQAGGSWSAEKSNKGVFYQEGGESFVAFASDFTEKGKGVYTSCITNGPCASDQIQYETYSFNPNTGILSASGTDAFGFFNSESTVDMAAGTSSVTKTYAATGLVIEMVVEEVPDQSFMFFGEFTFTSNEPGLEGTGRFANAFVEDCQTSFDSRNEQPQA